MIRFLLSLLLILTALYYMAMGCAHAEALFECSMVEGVDVCITDPTTVNRICSAGTRKADDGTFLPNGTVYNGCANIAMGMAWVSWAAKPSVEEVVEHEIYHVKEALRKRRRNLYSTQHQTDAYAAKGG